jgi:hypothetical protein
MGLTKKILLYCASWLLTLFATDPTFGLWPLAYMFPLGLAAFINRRLGNDGGWWVFDACIAVSLLHGWFYFRAKQIAGFTGFWAFLFLC